MNQIVLSNIEEDHLPECMPITADCGHECWIGPASLGMVSDPDQPTETKCMNCIGGRLGMLRLMVEQGGGYIAPGVRAELVRALGEQETERLFRTLHVREA